MLEFVRIAVLVTLVYAGVLGLYALGMGILAIVEAGFRREQDQAEDYESVLESPYAIPVSIIAPSFNEEMMAVPVLKSLLAQAYPTTEVIAVDDGSTDGTLDAMIKEFDLEPRRVSTAARCRRSRCAWCTRAAPIPGSPSSRRTTAARRTRSTAA
jgi:cellulose synthase/poly-beta-1,6-N-acetylglucosamine synthase-like glycosyltransferase